MGLAADGCSVSGEAIHFIPSPECRLRGLTTQRVGKERKTKGKEGAGIAFRGHEAY